MSTESKTQAISGEEVKEMFSTIKKHVQRIEAKNAELVAECHSLKTRTGHYKAEKNRMAKELGILASKNAELVSKVKVAREALEKVEKLLQDSCEHDDGHSKDCYEIMYENDPHETCNCYMEYRSNAIERINEALASIRSSPSSK